MSSKDLYTILGISRDATSEEISKAYKQLALKYHPDRYKGSDAEDRFKDISHAHSVLSDDQKRRMYDLTGNDTDNGFHDPFGGHPNVFFHFGGHREKVDYEVKVTYEELLNGTNKSVEFTDLIWIDLNGKPVTPSICPSCQGKSILFGLLGLQCHRCGNTGKMVPPGSFQSEKVYKISVNVPAKSWAGRIIESNGKKILLEPIATERLYNQDLDIIYVHTISLFQALLGFSDTIKIAGQDVKVDHPNIIKPKTGIVVNDMGLYDPHGRRGRIIVVFDVEFPKTLTDDQRKLIKQIMEKKS